MSKLEVDRLRELLSYEPDTGLFRWRVSVASNVSVGMIAGSVSCGYVIIGVDGRNYRAHRLAWLYMTGEWPPADIDHRDRDRSNNRWLNLRKATRSQNLANTAARANQSGFKGVWAHQGRWRSAISIDGRRRYLGMFDAPETAAAAYQAAAIENFGEFARGA